MFQRNALTTSNCLGRNVDCVQTMKWLPVLGIFNMRADVGACGCTRGLYEHRQEISALKFDCEKKNPIPHRRIKPWSVRIAPGCFSVRRCLCQPSYPVSLDDVSSTSCLAFSTIHVDTPSYLSGLLLLHRLARPLRFSEDTLTEIVQKLSQNSTPKIKVAARSPTLLQIVVPLSIQTSRHAKTLDAFKSKLQSYLFTVHLTD